MIPHDKDLAIGNLVGHGDITVAETLLGDIGFVEPYVIHVDGAVVGDLDPLASRRDDPLDQDVVVVVERDDVALLVAGATQSNDDVLVLEGVRHRGTLDLQDGQNQHGDQYRTGRYHKQAIECAAQGAQVVVAMPLARELVLEVLAREVWLNRSRRGLSMRRRVYRLATVMILANHASPPVEGGVLCLGAVVCAAA